MKVKTNCTECRKKIYKEAETAYLKHEYAIFRDCAYSMAVFSTTAALAVMHTRGRSKKYIKQFFEDMCFIYDFPGVMGKQIDMLSLKKQFEEKYGVDYNKIKIHLETEKEFLREMQKNG